ncbi:MAG TPA: 50S ribosomal protein L25 [Thermoanaerobaculia bacterium]|nr:50S ribosomal protein L25 [Thermoanaerobaculia bacterium]
MSDMTIEVQHRSQTGTNSNRRLRVQGKIPAVVYGGGKESLPIHIDRKTLLELIKAAGSDNAIFLLKLADTGKERHAMIRDLQVDPISREILHVDFQRVVMTEKLRVQVPIELVGTAYGVKTEGGMLDFVTREAHIECLPGDIPKRLELDVTALHIGQHLTTGDLVLPKGVELLDEADRVLVSLTHAKVEAEPEAPAAVEVAATPEEPEVVKRGKTEEE